MNGASSGPGSGRTTYRDFEWVTRDYPWIANGLFVTYVKDSDPATVIEAMTVEGLGTESGLAGVNERGWEEPTIIGAASMEDWTIAIAPAATAGASEELMRPLSLGREVLTHFRDVNAHAGFYVWEDGERTVHFDPLQRCGFGPGPMPAQWVPRLEEVGVNPDGDESMTEDGDFPVIEASLALAASYTSVRITPEFLSSATFIVGSAD
ncbi:DUF6461 domain-containing protein [Rhodococcus globerulus]|uniref:DUF6461 domain-containing protein n=1 Tax=Rhodococcus globerulus TaxID=33008 RepID=UPI00052799AC|nr:DUF6461 domain-containing protein [Rhodococcus globerulus]PVX59549.1 hypothetical protein C8E04_6116 [Rhodococcus globerulus]